MGKKYVVKIGRLERLYKASISAKGMPNMTWLSPEVDLTPYTEPDLEQVRKEAYAEGFKDGQYAERNGLVANYAQVHKIKIGDEVTAEHGGSTFTVTWMSDVCICGIDSDGRCYSYEINEVDGKTGNHHDIAAVLEKMRGEQDG